MDWSTLPGDLVRLVSGRLHDPLDFLRLRAVCRSWRSAAASPSPFLPWLLACHRAPHPTATALSFSLATATRSVTAPSALCRILGPTRSHLLSDNPHDLLLLNPLTGARLRLPLPRLQPRHPGVPRLRRSRVSAPVVLYNAKKLFFHFGPPAGDESRNPGDGDGWMEVPVPGLVAEYMYHGGKLFVCDDHRHVTAFDAVTLTVVGAVAPPPPAASPRRDSIRCIALVPSAEELLCVIRYFATDGRGELFEECGTLEVYRLEMGFGSRNEEDRPLPWRWVRMRSIGDRMLFVGLYPGFSFRAADFAGFKGDCIYYFKLDRAKRSFITGLAWRMVAPKSYPARGCMLALGLFQAYLIICRGRTSFISKEF